MLAKFKTSLVGSRIARPGEILDLPAREAEAHIQAGNASSPDEIETATFRARETALAASARRLEKEKERIKPAETR